MLLHSGTIMLTIIFEPADKSALEILRAASKISSAPQLIPEIIKGFFAFLNVSAILAARFFTFSPKSPEL